MTDLIAGGRAAGKMFSSLSPLAYRRRALVLSQTYGPMLVPGLVQKGLELKCLRVSGGTLLHFKASAPPSTK